MLDEKGELTSGAVDASEDRVTQDTSAPEDSAAAVIDAGKDAGVQAETVSAHEQEDIE